MGKYNKLWLALFFAVALGVRQGFLDDDHFSPTDWVVTANGFLAVLATWRFPNTPVFRYVKSAAAALILGGGVLVPLLADGWQWQADLLPAILAVGEGLGVLAVKNAGTVNGVFLQHRQISDMITSPRRA